MSKALYPETIGPELAVTYLEKAASNRTLRNGKVQQYARDMCAGRWSTTLIRFDEDDRLVDGQHRLWAVVESATTQTFYVERGVTAEAIKAIDTGLARTAGDHLLLTGETSGRALASVCRYVRFLTEYPAAAPSGMHAKPYSTAEIEETLAERPELRESTAYAVRLSRVVPTGASGLVGAVHHLSSRIDPEKADEFWEQLLTGADMTEDTAPYTLRRLLLTDRMRPYGQRYDANYRAAIIIKGWNYWQYDKPVKQLKWYRGTTVDEAFPIVGKRPK